MLFPPAAKGHGQGLATSIPVSICPREGFSSFLPPSLCQVRVAHSIIKIRKANSLMLYQAASVAGGLRPSSYPWGDLCYLSHSEYLS